MNRQARRQAERQSRKQAHSDPLQNATFTVYKVYPDGREEALATGLDQHQAQLLGDHYLVGCMPGETIKLRTPWIAEG